MARKATADTSTYWFPSFEPDLPPLPAPTITVGPMPQIDTPAPLLAAVIAANSETAAEEATHRRCAGRDLRPSTHLRLAACRRCLRSGATGSFPTPATRATEWSGRHGVKVRRPRPRH